MLFSATTHSRSDCYYLKICLFLLTVALGWTCNLVASFGLHPVTISSRHSCSRRTGRPCAAAVRPLASTNTGRRWWENVWDPLFQQPPGITKQAVLDMMDRSNLRNDVVVVVTGATGGLGQAIVDVVLEVGGRVWAMDRDPVALSNLVQKQHQDKKDKIRTVVADFADLESVARAAREVSQQIGGSSVDILVNNAGISYSIDDKDIVNSSQPLLASKQNHDLLFQINYLSHFLLTELLLPQINQGRIVSVTSGFSWGVNGTGLIPSGQWDPPASRVVGNQSWPRHLAMAYAHSKLAQIWHMAELNRRNHPNSTTLALCACPSWAATGISGSEEGRRALERLAFPTRPLADSEVAGPALGSIVNAMFLPLEEMDPRIGTGECLLGNANVLESLVPKSKEGRNHFLFSSWFDRHVMARIDATREFAVWFVLLLQRWFYQTLYFQPTSAESSNSTGQALLSAWSRQAVLQWLPTSNGSIEY